MPCKPTADRVLVKLADKKAMSAGGIVLPETARDPLAVGTGRVLAVGPGARDINGVLHPVAVAEGDVIVFKRYSGAEIEVEDQKFRIVDEKDIFAVFEK